MDDPFLAKNAFRYRPRKTRLETDADFRHEAITILLDLQNSETKTTKTTNIALAVQASAFFSPQGQ